MKNMETAFPHLVNKGDVIIKNHNYDNSKVMIKLTPNDFGEMIRIVKYSQFDNNTLHIEGFIMTPEDAENLVVALTEILTNK